MFGTGLTSLDSVLVVSNETSCSHAAASHAHVTVAPQEIESAAGGREVRLGDVVVTDTGAFRICWKPSNFSGTHVQVSDRLLRIAGGNGCRLQDVLEVGNCADLQRCPSC